MSVVPINDLRAQNEELGDQWWVQLRDQVLSGAYVGGERVDQFEREWAEFTGAEFCVGVANGTDAIQIALRAHRLERGAKVVVPALTFLATAEAVMLCGAEPVFCDVDLETGLVDLDQLDHLAKSADAVIPVHLWGSCVDLGAVSELAERRSATLIQDAAQAHGATSRGTRIGEARGCATFSFYPGKNLGAWGDAGALVTSDAELAQTARAISNHGRPDHQMLGTNSRLDAIQAMALSLKLQKLDAWNERRRATAAIYDDAFSDLKTVRPISRNSAESVYHHYVLRVDPSRREQIQKSLLSAGVTSGVHYPRALTQEPALASYAKHCPHAVELAASVLSIPVYPHLSDADRERVIQAVREAV